MQMVTYWKRAVLENYANFSGRATRPEYWWFFLANLILSVVLGFLPFIGNVYSLGTLLPGIAVAMRRLHDTGRSGWWLLLVLIPIVGWIIVIVWLATPGNPEANEHGAPPAAVQGAGDSLPPPPPPPA
ncbi:MAG: DUF805 domain-containing protein [Ilumatobacteraceae bacterium]